MNVHGYDGHVQHTNVTVIVHFCTVNCPPSSNKSICMRSVSLTNRWLEMQEEEQETGNACSLHDQRM